LVSIFGYSLEVYSMTVRNLSPHAMFEQLALEHVPSHHFAGTTTSDFAHWKQETLPLVMATLGDFPERVPLNPELLVEWDQDGLHKQRWMIDVGKHISAIFIVNIPQDLADGEKRPAILCWHGHGPRARDGARRGMCLRVPLPYRGGVRRLMG
jgi:hypothetical protein